MGAVLNSKSEFNRCYIPRLRVVEEDEASEMEKQEEEHAKEMEESETSLKHGKQGKEGSGRAMRCKDQYQLRIGDRKFLTRRGEHQKEESSLSSRIGEKRIRRAQ